MARSSFTKSIILVVSIAGAFALNTACFRPKAHDPALGQTDFSDTVLASFKVKTVSGKTEVTAVDPTSGWPTQKKFTFTACVVERITEVAAISERFEVIDTEVRDGASRDSRRDVKSDSKGCFSWSEVYGFNYLSDEVYLPLSRKLQAQGDRHHGATQFEIAINPWNLSGKMPDVVDLKTESAKIPEGAKVDKSEVAARLTLKATSSARKAIELKRFQLTGAGQSSQPELFSRTIQLGISPVIARLDVNKLRVEQAVMGIPLHTSAALIAIVPQSETGVPAKRYLAWVTKDPLQMLQGEGQDVVIDYNVSFAPIEITKVRYQLLVRVAPVSPIEGVMAFEGVFDLGSHSQLTDGGVLPERLRDSNAPGSSFSLEDSVRDLERIPVPTL